MPAISRRGVELWYTVSGEGPPVLFHTGGGGDGRMWHLAGYTGSLAGCRQILLDHRGHGRSSRPGRLADHHPDEYVADLIAVLDAAGAERATIVGYSGGGSVAFRAAAAHPDRCAAMVAIGAVPSPPSAATAGSPMAAHLRRVGMRAAMEEMAAAEEEPAPRWLIDNLAATPTEMFALLLDAWAGAGSVWDRLPGMATPTLVICGEREDPDGEAARVAALMPDATAATLPGYGHLQTFWHAEVTAPIIREFLGRRSLIGPAPAAL